MHGCLKVCVLERCLCQRDVCVREVFVLETCLSQRGVCLREVSVLERCLFQRDVCLREVSVLERCLSQRGVCLPVFSTSVIVYLKTSFRTISCDNANIRSVHACANEQIQVIVTYLTHLKHTTNMFELKILVIAKESLH